jgi:hypothetical protein
MAHPQSVVPLADAPTAPRRGARIAALSRPCASRSMLIARLVFALGLTAGLAVLGIAAARATESLAIGVIAADLAFLIAVAVWSAIYSGKRR